MSKKVLLMQVPAPGGRPVEYDPSDAGRENPDHHERTQRMEERIPGISLQDLISDEADRQNP